MAKSKPAAKHGAAILAVPATHLTRTIIEVGVEEWLNNELLVSDAATAFLKLKQLEYALEVAMKKLKPLAFNSIGEKLGGAMSGVLFGHSIQMYYPSSWVYSPAIKELVEHQKTALEIAQLNEQQEGKAHKIDGNGVLKITLAK